MPVAEILSKAGLQVVGCDISSNTNQGHIHRIRHARIQTRGEFAGIFIIFSHLQLSCADFHSTGYKYADALEADEILLIRHMPSDICMKDHSS